MKKLWLGSLVLVMMVLLAGAASAEDAGPFTILQKYGALYNSDNGWTVSCPPYYPGSTWAVDFTYTSDGESILHRDGAIWNATTGWNTTCPPYYPGSDYARDLEYLRDLTGCWGLRITQFETNYDGDLDVIVLERDISAYPDTYIEIEWQNGTRFGGKIVYYDPVDGCEEIGIEGTVNGDHFYAVAHNVEGDPGDECEVIDTISGLVFWNDAETRWELKGFYGGADLYCDLGGEAGFFGAFIAWEETTCECTEPE